MHGESRTGAIELWAALRVNDQQMFETRITSNCANSNTILQIAYEKSGIGKIEIWISIGAIRDAVAIVAVKAAELLLLGRRAEASGDPQSPT
jgi:hypothetical protein